MKPPKYLDYPEWDHKGMYHWDADTSKLPVRFRTQGVLFLTDTADNQGSFVRWPGAHKSLIDKENPWVPEISSEHFIQVPGKAGSLLIWHVALPHGNSAIKAQFVFALHLVAIPLMNRAWRNT